MWKDIKGFEGRYQMSDEREVRRLPYSVTQIGFGGKEYTRSFEVKYLEPKIDCEGYLYVNLTCDIDGDSRKSKRYRIHWLYYNTFIGDSDGMVIDHIDRNKLNNDPSNLRLVDTKINNINRTLPYKPDITDCTKHYQKNHNGNLSKPYMLRFSENGKRKTVGYFSTYVEAENKYRELYNERQRKIDEYHGYS